MKTHYRFFYLDKGGRIIEASAGEHALVKQGDVALALDDRTAL